MADSGQEGSAAGYQIGSRRAGMGTDQSDPADVTVRTRRGVREFPEKN
jgi:hypothetical protein